MNSNAVRPEVSKKNEYWLSKHRFYELKHFCLQYPTWKQAKESLTGLASRPADLVLFEKSNQKSDPTVRCAEAREFFSERMSMVEQAARSVDPGLASYILIGITEGLSYGALKAKTNIPCCKNTYYELYRKFFWELNKIRN